MPASVQAVVSGPAQISLTWSASSGAATYNIYWKLSTSSTYSIRSTTNPQFVHQGLTSGKTYQYAVSAVNASGESAASPLIAVLLAASRPPTALAAAAGNGQVTVTWSTVPGASSYTIYWSTSTPVTTASASVRAATSPYILPSLANNTVHYLAITAENIVGEGDLSPELTAMPVPLPGPVLTITGTVAYEDREYSGTGAGVPGSGDFTGVSSSKAVRYADIEVVSTGGGILASGTTDSRGAFSLPVTVPSTTAQAYVRVGSASSFTATPAVEVRDLATGAIFGVAGVVFPATGSASSHIRIPDSSEAAGAYNILDVLTAGAEFVRSLTGTYPPQLNAFWKMGNSSVGTYYCPVSSAGSCVSGSGMYVLGGDLDGSGDSDHYDDDVLWHEFGHFVADRYSRDDSPGGFHSLFDHDQDLRLSWSEGWGDFFPSAVKHWLAAADPGFLSTAGSPASLYVDTGDPGWSFDFDSADPRTVYATSESAIAKVLYKLMTGPAAGFDMMAIWNIMDTFIPPAPGPATFETFWEGWRAVTTDLPASADILAERQIFYQDDPYEPGDNTFSRLTPIALNVPELHSLYSTSLGSDVDIIPLNATLNTQYTVQTTSITNGGDTFIRILDPNQTSVITSNDNSGVLSSELNNCDAAGRCALASRVVFRSQQTGTYFIEVTTSASRPAFAGKYGSYELLVTSP